MNSIHIIFPVLNEERRIKSGINKTIKFMDEHFAGRYSITIVDNGSTDSTEQIALDFTKQHTSINYLKLSERGVGLAFREGIKTNKSDIVGYMDIDISTSLEYLREADHLFSEQNAQIVNASRLSKQSKIIGRNKLRLLTSNGLRLILKLFFKMKIDDAVCGFKFFRKETIEKLMDITTETNGWFYCIELMLRAERIGIPINELPVTWEDNSDTTVKLGKTISDYMKNIFRLRKEFRAEGNVKAK